jgi:hypothetical protein
LQQVAVIARQALDKLVGLGCGVCQRGAQPAQQARARAAHKRPRVLRQWRVVRRRAAGQQLADQ